MCSGPSLTDFLKIIPQKDLSICFPLQGNEILVNMFGSLPELQWAHWESKLIFHACNFTVRKEGAKCLPKCSIFVFRNSARK